MPSVSAFVLFVDNRWLSLGTVIDRIDNRWLSLGTVIDRVDNRWLSLGTVIDRVDNRWVSLSTVIDHVLEYFASLRDFFLKGQFETATKENARFKRICSHIKANELTLAHLYTVRAVCIDFERFLELFSKICSGHSYVA